MPPVLLSSNPQNSQVGVPINQVIRLTYSDIDPETITAQTVNLAPLSDPNRAEDLSIQVIQEGPNYVFNLYPRTTLASKTNYRLTLSRNIKDSLGNPSLLDTILFFSTSSLIAVDENQTKPHPTLDEDNGFPYYVNTTEPETTIIVGSVPPNQSVNVQLIPGLNTNFPLIGNEITLNFDFQIDVSGGLGGLVEHFHIEAYPIDYDFSRPFRIPEIESVEVSNSNRTIKLILSTEEITYYRPSNGCTLEPSVVEGAFYYNNRVEVSVYPTLPIISDSGTLDKSLGIVFSTSYFPFWALPDSILQKAGPIIYKKVGWSYNDLLYSIWFESNQLMLSLKQYGAWKDAWFLCPPRNIILYVECAVIRKMLDDLLMGIYVLNGNVTEKKLGDFTIKKGNFPSAGPVAKWIDKILNDNYQCLSGNWMALTGYSAFKSPIQGTNSWHINRRYNVTDWTRWRSEAPELNGDPRNYSPSGEFP